MNIKTESIREFVEIALNKKIYDLQLDELDKITMLRICRTDLNHILNVDSNDLEYFHNLNEIFIEGCTIDEEFTRNLKRLNKLKKITFVSCDFVDEARNYFTNLELDELVLNNVNGLNGVLFSNINFLTFVNCSFNCVVGSVNNLDISRSEKIAIDFENSDVKKIIINENQLKDLNYKGNITIKDNYDEIIRVINND